MGRRLQFLQFGEKDYATNMSWVGAMEDEEQPSVVDKVCPELKKLDELDAMEAKAMQEVKTRKISEEQYNAVCSVIYNKRDKLTTKLEKQGYFKEEQEEEAKEIEQALASGDIDEQGYRLSWWQSTTSGNRIFIMCLTISIIVGIMSATTPY